MPITDTIEMFTVDQARQAVDHVIAEHEHRAGHRLPEALRFELARDIQTLLHSLLVEVRNDKTTKRDVDKAFQGTGIY